jgi:hypothetical protein
LLLIWIWHNIRVRSTEHIDVILSRKDGDPESAGAWTSDVFSSKIRNKMWLSRDYDEGEAASHTRSGSRKAFCSKSRES